MENNESGLVNNAPSLFNYLKLSAHTSYRCVHNPDLLIEHRDSLPYLAR